MIDRRKGLAIAGMLAVALVLLALGGVAVARPPLQDITVADGVTPGIQTLYRDFGDYTAEVVSLAPYDSVSGAPYFLDVAHYEIHYGKMFHAEYADAAVADDGTVDVLLTVPEGTYPHTIFEVAVGGQSEVTLYESPIVSNTGTTIVPYNMNRPMTTTIATVGITHSPAITATGDYTLVHRIIPGGATVQTRVGGQSSKGVEWIFKPGTYYLLRITNTSGGAVPVSVMWEWYEGGS